ncbi:MAG: hypothetical protein K2W82_18740 [Candidatus Obscuribacterales bacterium]|nr:hypothetical protein [Candidatus Obscuribacterales bacterium]
MLHHKLLELEAELLAKEQIKNGSQNFLPESLALLEFIENQLVIKLASKVLSDWRGWLSYRRAKNSLVILRGRAFKHGGTESYAAGLDVPFGIDSISEYKRGFDIAPPQDLDHLLINFGQEQDSCRVFLWYGENFAPYRLILAGDLETDPHAELNEAIVEACSWIVKRPKHLTLERYLQSLS